MASPSPVPVASASLRAAQTAEARPHQQWARTDQAQRGAWRVILGVTSSVGVALSAANGACSVEFAPPTPATLCPPRGRFPWRCVPPTAPAQPCLVLEVDQGCA